MGSIQLSGAVWKAEKLKFGYCCWRTETGEPMDQAEESLPQSIGSTNIGISVLP
jgi:hypothetical protein